jgi:glycosyltransferase involved in cell wall biosynthesis
MAKRIWKARRNAARHSPPIEIAFNPMGVLLSDLSPGRPERRIAHFHETFMCPDTFVERRLRRSIRDYELVVVPDAERVRHTTEVLDLNTPPLVIENYPAKAENPPVPTAKRDGFEVVYCGTFGPDQRLDLLIDSAALWPEATRLVLIGNTNNRFGPHYVKKVQTMGLENRVTFLGWLEIGLAEARMAQADLAVSLLDSSSLQWRTALGASNKRYQYMKAALPQIGDTNPGIPELLEGNGIGACIREATPEALASLVAAYAADPERCHREGQRAFALHREQFNYSVVFRRLLDALGLCKSGGRDV